MAKSRASTKTSSASVEKRTPNQLAKQFYDMRAELRKVTWPTREEARKLTTAVTVGTVVIALFLYTIDAIFQAVVAGVVTLNIVSIIGGLVAIGLLSFAFYANSQDV